MKKQVVEGWAFPCDAGLFNEKTEHLYLTVETDKAQLKDVQCMCNMSRAGDIMCQPIKVKITVEAQDERKD